MRPLPEWLYSRYAHAYDAYREDLWSLDDAMRLWGDGQARANAVVSELRKRGHGVLLGREGRKRLYRLLSPEDFLFAFLHVPGLGQVQAEAYRPLIVKALARLRSGLGSRLVAVGLYGSVARGTPSKTSDVDLYAVADWASGHFSGRLDEALSTMTSLKEERLRLLRAGIVTDTSVRPVDREEATRFHSLQLDLSLDGIPLYDPASFLSGTWARMRVWLEKMGAERVETEKGWFWRLDPGLEVGSKV